ncbi:MAG: CbtA family protein [Pseudonocardiales bacterium]|nr:CbtA family protein [Pseudonocardiales bacterium]
MPLNGEHPATARALLVRGLAAGVVAGLLAAVVARIVGEPALDGALAYEDTVTGGAGVPTVDRATQRGIGLGLAYVLYGVAVGGILALAHAAVVGRLGPLGSRGTAAVVALVGFVAAVLVPFLKYPANPPASTIDHTVGTRTAANLVLLAASLLAAACAVALARRVNARIGWWFAVVVAAGGYLALVASVAFALPAVTETPADFPATVLYDFRVAALAAQVVLWTGWALAFAAILPGSAAPLALSDIPTGHEHDD